MDAFLSSIDPEFFQRWQAWLLVKRAELWEMVGEVCAAIHNASVLTSDMSDEAKKALMRDGDYFVPWKHRLEKPRKARRAGMSRAEMKATMQTFEAAYGPKG